MILQREIAAIAKDKNVANLTVDKDWVLGHFLDAIYSTDGLKDNLIFKGGNSYSAPRDYYDILMLSQAFNDLDYNVIASTFLEKMKFKGLLFAGTNQFLNAKSDKIVEAAWRNSLAHQVPFGNLPSFDNVKEELLVLFDKIFPKHIP